MTDVAKMQSHNSVKNIKRRAILAMRFAENTCPSSRHALLVAEALENRGLRLFYSMEEAEHAVASLYSVLESLWKARTKIANLEGK